LVHLYLSSNPTVAFLVVDVPQRMQVLLPSSLMTGAEEGK
jgi:hypothetical protein